MVCMDRIVTSIIAASIVWLFVGCERRELFVYGDDFYSVVLDVDWRQYNATRDPDGMTVWFYPLETPDHGPYRSTTANVRHHELYLPGGLYQGVVIDYSPEEYSRQAFQGLDSVATARVVSRPAHYQPDSLTIAGEGVSQGLSAQVNAELYGDVAWTDLQTMRTDYNADTGLYTVADQPETMGLDTLNGKRIYVGGFGDYIPYDERDSYQSTISVQQLTAQPTTIICQLRVRIHIKDGYNYLWQQVASISGLADGHLLAQNRNTERACLMTISDWEQQRTGANEGYIAATVNTFGLRPGSILPDTVRHIDNRHTGGIATDDRLAAPSTTSPVNCAIGAVSSPTRAAGDTEADAQPDRWWDYLSNVCLPGELRLNLSFVLRDHATTLHYHFNVGNSVSFYDHQLVLRIDLDPDISLPYVDAYSGTGFGADVTPWDQQTPIDVSF